MVKTKYLKAAKEWNSRLQRSEPNGVFRKCLKCAWKPGASSLAPYCEGMFKYPSSWAPFQAPARCWHSKFPKKKFNKPRKKHTQETLLTTDLWGESFNFWGRLVGYLGYVPGVCGNFLQTFHPAEKMWLIWTENANALYKYWRFFFLLGGFRDVLVS